jgi:hypothetical protein
MISRIVKLSYQVFCPTEIFVMMWVGFVNCKDQVVEGV